MRNFYYSRFCNYPHTNCPHFAQIRQKCLNADDYWPVGKILVDWFKVMHMLCTGYPQIYTPYTQ